MTQTANSLKNFAIKLGNIFWQKPLLPKRIMRPVYKRLVRMNKTADYPFKKDFYGIEYLGNLNNNIDYNIYFYGAFEKPLLHFLSDTMRSVAVDNAGVFIDVGANVGQHSLYMSRFAAQVHSFEPYALVRERLLLQISHNKIENIAVHAVGLSNENTRQPFFAPTGNNVGIGSFDASTVEKGNKAIGELELVRGDDFLKNLNLKKIDLIKIDVEGFERLALEGLHKILQQQRPILVCEITYGKTLSLRSRDELLQLLPQDYQLFTFDKRKADGSKARRRDAKARLSGEYRVISFGEMLASGQDDVIACPAEKVSDLPRLR